MDVDSFGHMVNGCVKNQVKILFGSGTKLTVQAKEKKPPSYYKVNGSCLATDFTRHDAVNDQPAFYGKNHSVRYEGDKIYSAFALGTENSCPESSDVCEEDPSSQDTYIESDEKMNFLTLGIFWLRILFLKTVGFNVLMTVKAWMS